MSSVRQPHGDDERQPLDLARFSLAASRQAAQQRPKAGNPIPVTGRFLKGPIPLPWLVRAGGLPGKALLVGLGLWYRAGMKKCRSVKASGELWRELGLTRHAAYRGMRALERAGLVSVGRAPGRAMLVTLLDFEDTGGLK